MTTVNPVSNDHPWDPNIVAVVDRCLLFRGHFCNKSPSQGFITITITNLGLNETTHSSLTAIGYLT